MANNSPVTSASAATAASAAPAPVPPQPGPPPPGTTRLAYMPLVMHPSAAALDAFAALDYEPDTIPDSDPEAPFVPTARASRGVSGTVAAAASASHKSESDKSDASDVDEPVSAPESDGEDHPRAASETAEQ